MKKSLSVGILCLSILAIQGCSSSKGTDSKPVITGDYLLFTTGADPKQEVLSGGTNLNELNLNASKDSIPLQALSGNNEEMTDRNNVKVGDKTYTRFVVSGTKYRYVRFGALYPTNQAIFFAQGFPTAEMPQEGLVNYQGDSVLYLPATEKTPRFTGIGKFAAIVNFSKKELTGLMDTLNADPQPINFTAKISGNKFTGNQEGVLVKGGFYGNNASEIGGYYKSGKNIGAFGGKKVVGQ